MPTLMHLADIHLSTAIGPQTVAQELGTPVASSVLDVLAALDQVAADARDIRPDAILLAGDTYHRIVNSRAVMAALARRLSALAAVAPVVLVIGNHDQASYTAHLFMDYQQFEIPNLYIVDSPRHICLPAQDGTTLDLFCMGWPTAAPGQENQGESLSDAAARQRRDLREWVSRTVKEGAQTARPGACRVLVAHGLVRNAYSQDELPLEWLKETCVIEDESLDGYDYVAMGHIHLRKVYRDRVVYPGSLYPASFGETDWPHGYAVAEVQPGQLPKIHFREISIRPYANLTLRTSQVASLDAAVTAILEHIAPDPRAFVRVHLIVDQPGVELGASALLAALNAHFGFVTVERTDTAVIKRSDLAAMSLEESLTVYMRRYMEQNQVDPNLRMRAMIRLRTLIASSQQ